MLQSLINQRLGRYLIKELLGRGGMAAVYCATDTVLQRDVALKILYPQYSDEQSQVERFQREAITAAALEHPHIVPIYDVDEQNGMIYIAMKLLHGSSLHDMLHKRGTLSPTELVAVIDPVAAALDYAHEKGIIHRDIKPGNIMIETEEGKPPQVMLTDFGIAKMLDRPGLTTTGALIGTPDYMAPEQISGQRLDRRVDVYSLGMLAFRTLTGKRAFEGSTQDVLLAHLHGAPPRPSAYNPQLTPAIDDVVLRAIDRDSARRQPSAGAFASELRAAVDGATLHRLAPPAARLTAPQPGSPMSNRPTTAVAIAANGTRRGSLPPMITTQTQATDGQLTQGASLTRTHSSPTPWLPWIVVLMLGLSVIGTVVFAISTLSRTSQSLNVASAGTVVLLLSDTPTPSDTPAPSATPAPLSSSEPSPASQPSTEAAPPNPTSAPTATPPAVRPATSVPAPLPTAPQSPAPSATASPTNTLEPTPSATASPTPSTTVSPTPSATPCPAELLRGGFGRLFKADVEVRVRLGCPSSAEAAGVAAQQFFERGSMFYWQANDTIYVFLEPDNGDYIAVPPADAATLPTPAPQADPNAPVRGFGRVYYGRSGIAEVLGLWLSPEELLDGGAVFQLYERGLMVYTPSYLAGGLRSAAIFVLYNDGSFLRVEDR